MRSTFNHLRDLIGSEHRGKITRSTSSSFDLRVLDRIADVHAGMPERADKESPTPARADLAKEIGTVVTISEAEVASTPN